VRSRRISISRQLGAIYLLIVVLLGAVCLIVLAHLDGMRTDSRRLFEETTEHAVTSSILMRVDLLAALAESWDANPEPQAEKVVRAAELVESIQSAMRELHGDPDKDPSRLEHQAAEDRTALRVASDLDDCLALLSDPGAGPEGHSEARRLLVDAERYAEELHEETRLESRTANRDLAARGRKARSIMLITVAGAFLALGGALIYVLRSIVRPIRELERGAKRLGRGDLVHRIPVRGDDEIGSLARAFNGMADRIAESHSDLEARVEARTREFLRAARLADLGVLAAGLAHEVNNPLASIASCAEGLERRLRAGRVDPAEESEYLRTIAAEAYRAREITGQLLSLASQERDGPTPVDVPLVLRQVEIAARHLLEPRGMTLSVEQEGDLSYAGSGAELMQILTNLVLNARDASPPGAGIRLRAERAADMVSFEVADQGSGIPAQDRERIFDPFFTTKRPGKGTGLGLSVVAALVEARGGRVEVESEPGRGATLRVLFPAGEAVKR
jgi:signal transduction histidine kinase